MIRLARREDLKEIVRVHTICFPDSFSTALGSGRGGRLLCSYYKEYLDDNPELFLVSENDVGINGFCMGYLMEKNDYTKLFIRQNFFNIVIRIFNLLIHRDKRAWNKIKSLNKKTEGIEFEDARYSNIAQEKR